MAPGILLSEDTTMVEAPSQELESDSSSPAVDGPEESSAPEQSKKNLEDMFDDDEDDELLSSLMPAAEGYVLRVTDYIYN
jgi:hypothetical protein